MCLDNKLILYNKQLAQIESIDGFKCFNANVSICSCIFSQELKMLIILL